MKQTTMKALLLCSAFSMGMSGMAQQQRDSLMVFDQNLGQNPRYSGNVETIDESQMNNKDQVTNALDAIRGRVAGLTVERNGLNAMNAVRLRGTTSLTGGNDPLIMIDGVLGDLSLLESIFPSDIESFTILKDAAETSQFGSRGASGVIIITTRQALACSTTWLSKEERSSRTTALPWVIPPSNWW